MLATKEVERVILASPRLFNVPVPKVVEPFLNVMRPVGNEEDGEFGVTKAVRVTDSPYSEGFKIDDNVVVD